MLRPYYSIQVSYKILTVINMHHHELSIIQQAWFITYERNNIHLVSKPLAKTVLAI